MCVKIALLLILCTSRVGASQRIVYELLEGSQLEHLKVDPEGNREIITTDLHGTCSIELRQGDLELELIIRDIDFHSDEPKYEVIGRGSFLLEFSEYPLARGGVQSAAFYVNINEFVGIGMASLEPQTVPLIFPEISFGVSGNPFGMHLTAAPRPEEPAKFFRRGDVNQDGDRNITDPVSLLLHLFKRAPEPPCLDAADSNDDGKVDLADAVFLLNHLFAGSVLPPIPGRYCGLDPTEDELGCNGQIACISQ